MQKFLPKSCVKLIKCLPPWANLFLRPLNFDLKRNEKAHFFCNVTYIRSDENFGKISRSKILRFPETGDIRKVINKNIDIKQVFIKKYKVTLPHPKILKNQKKMKSLKTYAL